MNSDSFRAGLRRTCVGGGMLFLAIAGLSACSGLNSAARLHPDIVIDDVGVFPESLSAARDGSIYIGSIKGTVFRAAPGSSHARAWLTASPQNGILSLLGVLVDEGRRALWLCSAENPLARTSAGRSALISFDLSSRRRTGFYPLPPPNPNCNDITIANDGSVFASDTPNGRVFVLRRGATALTLFAEDPRLKGIDGIVFSADGTLYVTNVRANRLLRIDRQADGSAGTITELSTTLPVSAPDGFRLIAGNRFLLAENASGSSKNGGRIDEVTIERDVAHVRPLREGLKSPTAVTLVGHTAYALESKFGYMFDPQLQGKDPGPFKVYAVALDRAER